MFSHVFLKQYISKENIKFIEEVKLFLSNVCRYKSTNYYFFIFGNVEEAFSFPFTSTSYRSNHTAIVIKT